MFNQILPTTNKNSEENMHVDIGLQRVNGCAWLGRSRMEMLATRKRHPTFSSSYPVQVVEYVKKKTDCGLLIVYKFP